MPSMQVAPFSHGLLLHSSTSENKIRYPIKHCRSNVKLVMPLLVLQLQTTYYCRKIKTICLQNNKFLEHDKQTMADTYKRKQIINQSFDNILSEKLRLTLLANNISSIIFILAISHYLRLSWNKYKYYKDNK